MRKRGFPTWWSVDRGAIAVVTRNDSRVGRSLATSVARFDRTTPRFILRENLVQDLCHSHPAAVFNPLCATQQYRMSRTNDFRQVRCNVAQCGRRRRKYNQVGIGAITSVRSNVH